MGFKNSIELQMEQNGVCYLSATSRSFVASKRRNAIDYVKLASYICTWPTTPNAANETGVQNILRKLIKEM